MASVIGLRFSSPSWSLRNWARWLPLSCSGVLSPDFAASAGAGVHFVVSVAVRDAVQERVQTNSWPPSTYGGGLTLGLESVPLFFAGERYTSILPTVHIYALSHIGTPAAFVS